MRPKRSSLALLLAWVAFLAWADDPASTVSQYRIQLNLSAPDLDQHISTSAQARADELARLGVLSHGVGEGHRAGDELTAAGYPPGTFGEVLGAGPDWASVWRAWLASSTHRAVLEGAGWLRWGWGRSLRGTTEVWVLRFWRP